MLYIIVILVLLFLLIPVYLIVPLSFSSAKFMEFPPPGFSMQWYEKFFATSKMTNALINSCEIGLLSTLLALILGFMAAYGLAKSNSKLNKVLEGLYQLPMVIPAIIIAIAIYRFEVTIGINGSKLGIVCAHTLLELPYVVSTMLSRLITLDPNYENASMSLGAGKLQTYTQVIIPTVWPAILSSAMFAFSVSFDEAVITLFVAGIRTSTLPKVIFETIQQEFNPSITAISAIIITVVTIVMFAINAKEIFYKKEKEEESL